MKGELGRNDKTASGKDICDRSDRERINLERSLLVDPFARASRQNRISDFNVRDFGELEWLLVTTHNQPEDCGYARIEDAGQLA